jgi:protocatechuate 3,4-dioxygenase beta subunit
MALWTSVGHGAPANEVSASGKVVDAAGRPVAGAQIVLREWAYLRATQLPAGEEVHDILARTNSDSDGRFAFHQVPSQLQSDGFTWPWDVIAYAPGNALAWQQLTSANQDAPITLVLRPGAELRGRVLQEDGKPAAGVHVQVMEIAELGAPPMYPVPVFGVLFLYRSEWLVGATSDAAGYFTIRDLPVNRRFILRVADDRFVRQTAYAATTTSPQPGVAFMTIAPPGAKRTLDPVYTGAFTLTLKRSSHVHGYVQFADSGKPAASARACLRRTKLSGTYSARVDAQGHFSLSQFSPGEYELEVLPPAGMEYMGIRQKMIVRADQPDQEINLSLSRGIMMSGQVVEEGTRNGVGDVPIDYSPAPGSATGTVAPVPPTVRTDANGRFRIVVPSGKGRLWIANFVPGYAMQDLYGGNYPEKTERYARSFDARPGQVAHEVRFAIGRGVTITIHARDHDGRPVAGAQVVSHSTADVFQSKEVSNAEGVLRVPGISSHLGYELAVIQRKRRLAAIANVSPKPTDRTIDLEVQLEPAGSATGHVLDNQGRAIAGAWVDLSMAELVPKGTLKYSIRFLSIQTDDAGQFRFDNLIPRTHYIVEARANGHDTASVAPFESRSGQTYSVPDFRLAAADRELRGVVLTPAGRPLPQSVVQISSIVAGRSSHAQSTAADPEGRFEFTGLPAGKYLVSAYRTAADTGSTQFTNSLEAAAGERNLQIILPVPPGSGATQAASGRPAPEFEVKHWHPEKGSPPRGFVLRDFAGKVIVLAFMDQAHPSQRVLERIRDLAVKLSNRKLQFICVYENMPTDPRESEPWGGSIAAAEVACGIVAGGHGEAFEKYGVDATPTLFLVDRQGILRHIDLEADRLEEVLEALLKSN